MSFEEQIMSKDNPSILSPQLEAVVSVYYPSNPFCNMRSFEFWGYILGYSLFSAGEYLVT